MPHAPGLYQSYIIWFPSLASRPSVPSPGEVVGAEKLPQDRTNSESPGAGAWPLEMFLEMSLLLEMFLTSPPALSLWQSMACAGGTGGRGCRSGQDLFCFCMNWDGLEHFEATWGAG